MTRPQDTRRRISLALIAGSLSLFAATDAGAQRWGRPDAPRSGACFYRDANFQGDYFCVRAGDAIESLPGRMNDEISSIRTFGRDVEVTVYQNREFKGRSERFTDVRNLRDEKWNDRLSSLRVDTLRNGNNGRPAGRFGGGNGNVERIIRRAYEDILNREPDTQGLRTYRSRMIDDGWTEQQVREALRDSREYRERNTMTRERATEIVRRAYRDVLNREPDPGSQGYVERVLRDGWTEQDVARELRRSPESRDNARDR
jgi:hypothetical protein